MLSLPSQSGHTARVPRHWKTAVAADAAGLAIADAFVADRQPNGLTVVYAATAGDGRNHGARAGLVRRVIGSQWHPVPALQALAAANRIEAYSLPAGVINSLFRDIAGGLPGHLSRSGLGTSTDPRNGGGRLNTRTREQLVRLVRPAGDEALLFRGFPIDVALIGVAFMEGTAAIAMTRESLTLCPSSARQRRTRHRPDRTCRHDGETTTRPGGGTRYAGRRPDRNRPTRTPLGNVCACRQASGRDALMR